ncbi:hypothetical protein [Xanthomonas translucens]|uniref:Uncharacterized protein n=1 Tax=Xanthomonas translucens pv. translucens TaxID=134875 RepID=A0ABW9L1U7_XANCT|nr:hypothetical protein [Xanthomonas translucens]
MKKYLGALLVLVISFSAHAEGGYYGERCDTCLSEQQFQDLAMDSVDVGGVVIYNLPAGEIRKYIVVPPDRRLMEVPVEPELAEYFVNLVGLYRANGNSLEKDYAVTMASAARAAMSAAADGTPKPANAYEAIHDSAKMNNLLAETQSSWQTLYAGANYLAGLINPRTWISGKDATVILNYRLADGSTVQAYYDYGAHSWKRLEGSARDAHNNSIPEKKEDMVKNGYQTYNFQGPPATDLGGFINHVINMGIPSDIHPDSEYVICRDESTDSFVKIHCYGTGS